MLAPASGLLLAATGLLIFRDAILGFVAVFSFYFAFSGYRVLSRKRPADGPTAVDWAAVACLGLASLGILVASVLAIRQHDIKRLPVTDAAGDPVRGADLIGRGLPLGAVGRVRTHDSACPVLRT